MLKWAQKHERISMRGSVKRLLVAPLRGSSDSHGKSKSSTSTGNETPRNDHAPNTPQASSPGADIEELNSQEVNELINLNVTLPDGQQMDVSVEYNTAMLDLLVCLADKSRLNPTVLTLVLLSEDTGEHMSYKPNQTVGSLGGRLVQIVNKDAASGKSTERESRKKKSFEVTQRFTVNLPNGHKSVVRVSPLTTVGDLTNSVCKDKGLELDLSKYALQIPKKPGTIDLNSTVQQLGVNELNLVFLARQDKNYTMSMPDLSKPPPSSNQPQSFTDPGGAQQKKKKRGFLSFLSKKDKKFKSASFRSLDYGMHSSFDNITPPRSTPTTPTSIHRQITDQNQHLARPKSMYVSSNTPSLDNKSQELSVTPLVAPPRKKRRAPEPPVLSQYTISENEENQLLKVNGLINNGSTENSLTLQRFNETDRLEEVATAVVSLPSETPMILHSSNSSDSSGYHDLTHSRCESPEVNQSDQIQIETSIGITSLDSTNSFDVNSKSHFPTQVPLNRNVQEMSEDKISFVTPVPISDSSLPHSSDTLTLNKTKKPPVSSSSIPTPLPSTPEDTITSSSFVTEVPARSSTVVTNGENSHSSIQNHSDKTQSAEMPYSNFSGSDENKNELTTLNFNDILNGIVFDDEPWPDELHLARKVGIGDWSRDHMMMETASVTSENIEQIDISSHSERPCSFIPPPPPSEPPPPEHQSVDLEYLTSTTTPIFVDKGTEVNDDNTSLATSSTKSSPGRVSSDYVHEMAVFVERMNKMDLESPNENNDKVLNYSVQHSSPHIPNPHNLDTESVIMHVQTDVKGLGSKVGSLTGKNDQKLRDMNLPNHISESDDLQDLTCKTNFVVSEEAIEPLSIVSPPQELDDKAHILHNDKVSAAAVDDDDDEEYYTVIIEELIIPIGPNGYDFSAARLKTDADRCTVQVTESVQNTDLGKKSDISAATLDSPASLSSTQTTTYQSQPVLTQPSTSLQLSKREEFVLTSEDLSHVSFLPPKLEVVKTKIENQSSVLLSSTSSIMSEPDSTMTSTKTTHSSENYQLETAQNDIKFNSEAHHYSATTKKPTALPRLPTAVRPSIQTKISHGFSDDDHLYNSDPMLTKLRPHLLMSLNSHLSSRSNSHQMEGADYLRNDTNLQRSFSNGAGSDAVADNVEQPGSITSAYNDDTQEHQDVLRRQYYSLQSQLNQWQEQLAWNQSLLASQAVGGPELQAEHLQHLTDQMALQHQMMQQLQSTMLALQQQQNMLGSGQEHIDLSAELPARMNQLVAGAAEPAYVGVEVSPSAISPAHKQPIMIKAGSNTAKRTPKFERALGPREQLMIAIRTFPKRGLKSVPIEKTRWTPSVL